MGTTFFVLALLQCALLFFLSRVGSRLDREERKPAPQRTHWPRTGLIVPAGGNHPRMREALESLLKQDYPALYPVIVTATADEPAAGIARELQARYPQLRHVVAGFAKGCGQKNHNSLKGVEAVEDEVELLAFCDSTHIAPRDFIRRLVAPVVDGEDFSTGYHKVVARDTGIVTMAYALCVQLMRYLQGISSFTQLWGGAMCFRLSAFRRYGVREFWMTNVVDDCSLADRLIRLGARIRLSGDAVLMTEAREHDLGVWHHWMDRQILFLKFCIPYQWVQLVNFWPDIALDEYIQLEGRVKGRMALLDASATGEENVLEAKGNGEMNDLKYRRQQLQQLKSEVLDLEDISGGISITDFAFDDFRVELQRYAKEHPGALENSPAGLHAVAPIPDELRGDVKPGVVFCLKQNDEGNDPRDTNPVFPYYVVYVSADGEVMTKHTQPKPALDIMRAVCSGHPEPIAELCREFNRETRDGTRMDAYTDLLDDVVAAITGTQQDKGIESLFSLGEVGSGTVMGFNDYSLVCFAVLR